MLVRPTAVAALAAALTPVRLASAACAPAYSASTTYDEGDVVSQSETDANSTTVTFNYACVSGPNSAFCNQVAFAPGGLFSDTAWTKEATPCTGTAPPPGTASPTSSPNFVTIANAGGCPAAFDAAADYESGDTVSLNGFAYECTAGPNGLYCEQNGFEPGSLNGGLAWNLLGYCSGTTAPTTSPNFVSLVDLGGCPDAFDGSGDYEPGDSVSLNGLVYQCKPEPLGRHCSQAGFEPGVTINAGGGDVNYWTHAWDVTGYCSGTITPTQSPSFDVLTNFGGCPEAWVAEDFKYEEGDKVSDGKFVYQCKAWPFSRHCGQMGYEPDTNPATPLAWKDAWTVVGYCEGSGAPTTSPVFTPAGSVGVCPDAWARGSNVAYEEGDMVSVTVSASPLRQVAYRCKAWPFSGFCGQFSPIEFGGDQGWVFAGSCDGSIGPTQSPSFDSLSSTGMGCPEMWSASTTTYEAGDLVSYAVSASPMRKIVFQCREWPNNGYCNQGSGFEPTTRYANLAWTLVGTCDGSMAPTTSPAAYTGTCEFNKCVTTQVPCTAGNPGCVCSGSSCTTPVTSCSMVPVLPWSNSVTYAADDVVRVGVKQFKCKAYPQSLWCSQSAYMPALEDNGVWPQAWTAMGDCP